MPEEAHRLDFYAVSIDEEHWVGEFDSCPDDMDRDDLERTVCEDCSECSHYYVGRCEYFRPRVDLETVLDGIYDQAAGFCECGDEYVDTQILSVAEGRDGETLRFALQEALDDWLAQNDLEQIFYSVYDWEQVPIREGEVE